MNTDTSTTSSYLKQADFTKPQTLELSLKSAEATSTVVDVKVGTSTIPTNAGIEAKVRTYFADIPLMAEVAKCESRFRQYDKKGEIFRGKVNNKDVGVMQINEHYHLERAEKLGYNIYTVAGNLAYARLLYKQQGADPWNSSSPCWDKSDVARAKNVSQVVAER